MIIKLIRKEQREGHVPCRTTDVFEGVTNYRETQLFGEPKTVILSFEFQGEQCLLDLMEYEQAYVMNDGGKTIETLRNVGD